MSKRASERVQYYANPNGPVIGTCGRKVIEKDGLFFKDLDGSGEFKPYDDWRLPAKERAEAFTRVLTADEKLGQLFVNSWRTGFEQSDKDFVDESGLLDEKPVEKGSSIFATQSTEGTTKTLKEWWVRHLILRSNPKPDELTHWINQLHAVAEECEHFVPVQVLSNSRNENGEVVFGMNDALGVFAAWPGTLGIAAAVKGDRIDLVDDFADCIRREWDATGMKKGYMYMADVVSDPRWQRTYGTFGEDPRLICDIFDRIIPIIQGSADGLTADGVAMTVKHFPGGGARENGFDPHYAMGQWNVYATEGSLQKYHLPGFQVAVDRNAASIMPYYAKPAAAKSRRQTDMNGQPLPLQPYGFAFNKPFINDLLREQMGFKGYINSDSGITRNMCWGVEMLDVPERVAFAINTGVDVISGSFDVAEAKIAYERATNGYYDTHPIPEGFTKEQLVLTDEALNRAVSRTLTELFELGMFENPYRDPQKAVEVVSDRADWDKAMDVHRKSVVLLKNDGALPLTADRLSGKAVYAECFHKNAEAAEKATAALRQQLADEVTLTDDPSKADFAILLLSPQSGEYFNATPGYLELDICDGKTVCNVDGEGRPMAETHVESTLAGANRIAGISRAVRANGGKVIANVNVTLAWQLGNVEPHCDALLAGFDTYTSATLDVIFGRFSPTGKLPLTLPRGDEVLAVDADGVCISPNDVPGYDKDAYMPDSLKDENGKAYAYRDAAGNYYEMNFGLRY
ncbi:MAG: glycoside hydrolase family 3 N-terminal domain-containing protein [Clostridia bacterium]|nr:glycoside hydrolase family 3 N-terminal domain-containing protein [Clostridia bacterium]